MTTDADGANAPAWVQSVTPAEIVQQRSLQWPDFHPEDFCWRCGQRNPCWFADTEVWQTATGSTGDGGGVYCPTCFAELWETKTGKTAILWRLSIDPRSRDAAVPGPRFRDQLAEDFRDLLVNAPAGVALWMGLHFDEVAARIEARVQAAANQRAVEELRAAAVVYDGDDFREFGMWLRDRAAALASPAPAGQHFTDAEAGCASCPHGRDSHAHDYSPGEAYCVADGCPCMNYRSASGQGAALGSPAPAPPAETGQ